MPKLAKQKLLIKKRMKKREEKILMFTEILPDPYCKPIVGTNVTMRHIDVPIPQNTSLSLPSAMLYAKYPISNANRTLIIVRKIFASIF